jgi:hypothetical protein
MAAARAEAGAWVQRRSALLAPGSCGDAPVTDGEQELVNLAQALFERDDLGRLLVNQVLAEPVLAVHLEHEATDVADLLLAKAEQAAALAAKVPGRRERPPPRRTLRRALGVRSQFLRSVVAETVDQ